MATPKKYSPDPKALKDLRRLLWTQRAAMAVALLMAALFFAARVGPLDQSHALAAGAFLAIFLAGGRRRIAMRIADIETFEVTVDAEKVRWKRGEDRGEILRSDITGVSVSSTHLELKRASTPYAFRIPRQLIGFDELRAELGGR